MYAVIETGGKQYRVELGTELEVELLDVQPGASVTLDRVLLVVDGETAAIGRPLVTDAKVSAQVLRQDRGDKVISFKYRPKARRRVKKGHRQDLTVLRISDIVVDGKSAASTEAKATEDRKTERQRLEEAARRQADADAALAAKLAAARAEAEAGAAATAKAAKTAATAKTAKTAKTGKGAAAQPKAAATGSEEAPQPKSKRTSRAAAAAPTAKRDTALPAAEAKPKRARPTKKDE